MGVTAFPFDAVLDVTPSTLLGNDTATAAPAKALTTTQVRALLGVYTTAQVDALLSGKSDAGHTHAYSSLTGIPATFPPSAHNQAWSTITGTPTTLAGYGITDAAAVWGSISGVLANQTDLASALSGKSDTGHTHAYSSLTGIPSTFAPSAHKASHATGQPDALSPGDIGAVPTARTLTINGTAFDLSADRSWTVSGGGGGISSLNGLTDATQTFQTGTTGTDFGIVSAAGVHTFNLPDASATARGAVTTGTQRFAGIKYFDSSDIRLGAGINDARVSTFGSGTGTALFIDNNIGQVINFRCAATFVQVAISSIEPHLRVAQGLSINNTFLSGGTNVLQLRNGAASQILQVFNTYTNDSNLERIALQFATYASARYAQLACESAGTGIANMSLVLSPKGIGALIAGPMPDGTATGGNARGAGSVDLQLTRNAATQVASGTSSFNVGSACTASGAYSFAAGTACRALGQSSIAMGQSCVANTTGNVAIGYEASATGFGAIALGSAVCNAGYGIAIGGRDNISNGNYSVAIGNFVTSSGTYSVAFQNCTAGGNYSWAHGLFSSADRPHLKAYAQGNFASRGDAQSVEWVVRCRTTDGSTPVTLLAEASRMTIPSGKILCATMQLVGSKSDGTTVATYMRKFAIRNRAGTTELIGAVETIGTDVPAGTSMSVAADDTNDALNVSVVGVAGETWRWLGSVYGVELAYGA